MRPRGHLLLRPYVPFFFCVVRVVRPHRVLEFVLVLVPPSIDGQGPPSSIDRPALRRPLFLQRPEHRIPQQVNESLIRSLPLALE